MIRVVLTGLAGRPVRTALTTLAIVIGVAFVCAAYTLTDTMRNAANTLSTAAYDGTDAVVLPKTSFSAVAASMTTWPAVVAQWPESSRNGVVAAAPGVCES